MLLDSYMSRKTHIKALKNKLNKVLKVFYFLKGTCSIYMLTKLYFELIQSILEHGIDCWMAGYNTNLYPVQIIQIVLFVLHITKAGQNYKDLFFITYLYYHLDIHIYIVFMFYG